MKLPPADLSYVLDRFIELAEQIDAISEDSDADRDAAVQLNEAMPRLLDLLARLGDQQASAIQHPGELTSYGDYGLHMLDQLADAARRAERQDLGQAVEQLSLAFALWIVRQGGELRQLRAVVNALAQLAEQTIHPGLTTELYGCSCELIEAASTAYEQHGAAQAAEPWRVLLIKRAVLATRSCNPELMEPAYEALVEQLPADAERFFADGMEQIAVSDYPEHARELVRRFFLAHSKPRHLH
jgi:hypothetical protein